MYTLINVEIDCTGDKVRCMKCEVYMSRCHCEFNIRAYKEASIIVSILLPPPPGMSIAETREGLNPLNVSDR